MSGKEQNPGNAQSRAALRDVFPRVSSDRVREVMEVPDFKAQLGVMELSQLLTGKQREGLDVERELGLLHDVYPSVMRALQDKVTAQGYDQSETSAAQMVSMGQLALPE